MSWMRRRLYLLLCVTLLLVSVPIGGEPQADAEKGAFTDVAGHWALDTIAWGVEHGVVNGFPDGTFGPNKNVTQAQFTAMLFRAFPDSKPAETAPYWYSAYYKRAVEWNWPVSASHANVNVTRGKVAQIIAASQGPQLIVEEAVAYLLDKGFAAGRRVVDGRVDFGADATLTRAEAVQFVRNSQMAGQRIGPANEPPASEALTSDALLSVAGIAVGDSVDRVIAMLGQPARKDLSEYGFSWYVYNNDYTKFAMVGVKDGKVVGLYANGTNLLLKGLGNDANAAAAVKQLGSPLNAIRKGNVNFLLSGNGEYDVFEKDGVYLTIFYDIHENGVVTGAQAIETSTEQALTDFYGSRSDKLRTSYERVTLDLANSARGKQGLPVLAWDDGASVTARGHSEDMAANEFFDHTNLLGEDLGDRLQSDKVSFRLAGENIAYGQTSAIFAHEGWMNSLGHRHNLLGDFRLLGVGVAFTGEDVPYYTQNFLKR
jgi:uncharacterized protein YkwD